MTDENEVLKNYSTPGLRKATLDRPKKDKVYHANGNSIFYPIEVTDELFLTVHATSDSRLTIEQQAIVIAQLLNENT